ncbi:hypothetical protein AS026_28105 [Rhizobium altiplani]|uniref:Uncharacterized protein n=1 Tax=Rhizobium altiplani TaxID=1864509 RepID=A0A109K2P1_9HYPH|nr:hypothetical protein AS026_28105 [Rhizobium altiplani]
MPKAQTGSVLSDYGLPVELDTPVADAARQVMIEPRYFRKVLSSQEFSLIVRYRTHLNFDRLRHWIRSRIIFMPPLEKPSCPW